MTEDAGVTVEAPAEHSEKPESGVSADRIPSPVRSTPTVNGIRSTLQAEPRRLLVDVLRADLDITTTTTSCSDGVCGTCTILVDGDPVRACLMLTHEADGRDVRTCEDVLTGPLGAALSRTFSTHGAIQCGFCTPGFMVLAAAMVEQGDPVSEDDLLDLVSDNICRCTGYGPILNAFRAIASDHGILLAEATTA